MSFTVPFHLRDVIGSLSGAQVAASDRNRLLATIPQQIKKAKTPLQKLVLQREVSQVDPAYQEAQIAALAGTSQGEFQDIVKSYIQDRSRQLDDKTGNRLRSAQLVGGIGRPQYGEYPLQGYEGVYEELDPTFWRGAAARSRSASRPPAYGQAMFEEEGFYGEINPEELQRVENMRAYEEEDRLRQELRGSRFREIRGGGAGELDIMEQEASRQLMEELAAQSGVGVLEGGTLAQQQDFVRAEIRRRANPQYMAEVASEQTFYQSPFNFAGASGSYVNAQQFQWTDAERMAQRQGWPQNPMYGYGAYEPFYIPPDLLERQLAKAQEVGFRRGGSLEAAGSATPRAAGGGARGRPAGYVPSEMSRARQSASMQIGTEKSREVEGLLSGMVQSVERQLDPDLFSLFD